MIIVYGIPNCDIIKKTTTWLQFHKVSFRLHDYRKEGIGTETLSQWCAQVGWETLFNKRSTTWKELDPATQASVTSEAAAIAIMQQHVTIIKRPVVVQNGKVITVGFNEQALAALV